MNAALDLRPEEHVSAPGPVGAMASASPGLRLITLNQLDLAELDRWDALAAEREGTNPFAEPWMLRLSLAHCDEWQRARIGMVSDDSGELLGVIPLRVSRAGARLPLRMWTGWSHANQFTGTPLVRRGKATQFWTRLLAELDRRQGGALALSLLALPVDEPVNQALFELCRQQGRRVVIDKRWQRASLEPGVQPLSAKPKQRRRIEGLERKLEREVGPITFEVVRDMPRIAAQVERFLRLEQSGWKGEAGSALGCRGDTRRFFSDAALAAAARGQFDMAVLSVDGEVIAMSTQIISGGILHGFKAAYDERYGAYAPGLLLLSRMTAHWLEGEGVRVDSCAKADQQPLSSLWSGRRELVDCRVAVGGGAQRLGFALQVLAERGWHLFKRLSGQP